MAHSHTVRLPLGALLTPCTLRGRRYDALLFVDADVLVAPPRGAQLERLLLNFAHASAPAAAAAQHPYAAAQLPPAASPSSPMRLDMPQAARGAVERRVNAGFLLLRPSRAGFDALLARFRTLSETRSPRILFPLFLSKSSAGPQRCLHLLPTSVA